MTGKKEMQLLMINMKIVLKRNISKSWSFAVQNQACESPRKTQLYLTFCTVQNLKSLSMSAALREPNKNSQWH
jgi:hypothetical protein